MRIISVVNQKGGVGKTTTAVNLGHALALAGKRVVLLDIDPQGHSAVALGVDRRGLRGMDRVLLEGRPIAEAVLDVRDGLQLVPAGLKLAEFEFLDAGGVERGWRLRNALAALSGADIVLIDCPPSCGLLTMNALLACEEVLVPVSGDYLSMDGAARFMGIHAHIVERLKRVRHGHILLTRFRQRLRMARAVREKLQACFPGRILPTAIRDSVAIAEGSSHGKTIFDYRRHSRGADDFRALAAEILTAEGLS